MKTKLLFFSALCCLLIPSRALAGGMFEHSVNLSYAPTFEKGDVVFVNSGYRDYGCLHPVTLDYTFHYVVNPAFSLGVGAGILYNFKALGITGDEFLPLYGEFKEKQIDVPLFLAMKYHLSENPSHAFVDVLTGCYMLSKVWYGEVGLGYLFPLGEGKAPSLQLMISARTTPWPWFDEEGGKAGYKFAFSPCLKLGFNF